VSCLPKWRLDNGYLDRFPTDENIIVTYDSNDTNLDAAVRPAIERLNDLLSDLGLSVPYFDVAPGTACATNDAHCVTVDMQNSAINPAACGWRYSEAGTNGVYTYKNQVHIRNGYSEWPIEAQNWAISQEFLHLLGLDDQDSSCANSGSAMHPPVTCGNYTGYATLPTLSDVLPVVKTVYQSAPRTTCG
jgi:hypothetical protein